MDSLEVNKAFAAVLTAGIVFMVSGLVAENLVHPHRLAKSVIKIEGVEAAGATAPSGPPAPALPIATLLASADPAAGDALAKKLCVSCHSFNQGGKAGVGPNLYGVVGAPHGHMDGYQYSAAIKGKQGPWTFDELNEWLINPRGYAPGTKMAFAGIGNDKQRADVIGYLRTLSPNPLPLPPPPQATTPAATPAAAPGGASPAAPQTGPGAPSTEGATRPQPGQVTGRPGQAQAGGQQVTQPSASQNQPQLQQNQAQQPPQATQAAPAPANQSGSADAGTRPQTGQTTGAPGTPQVEGQQQTQPSASQNQPQAEQNNNQQPPQAGTAPGQPR